MKSMISGVLGTLMFTALASTAWAETTLTIATVNNGDMIRMQGLTEDFTKDNPDIKLEWVTLEENVLREKVTTDIATKGGQFDVLTIGTYEVPIWGKKGWLVRAERDRRSGRPAARHRVAASPSTASSMPRPSTAKARWSCIAPT